MHQITFLFCSNFLQKSIVNICGLLLFFFERKYCAYAIQIKYILESFALQFLMIYVHSFKKDDKLRCFKMIVKNFLGK